MATPNLERPLEAVVLAGGLGKRLSGVVKDVPKPMAPVHGRPFLEYLLSYWVEQGIRRFVLSIGYRKEVIERHFGGRFEGAEIEYAVEEEPLGTGGAIFLSRERLRDPSRFLLLNGDTFFEVPLRPLMDFHAARSSELTFSLARVPRNDRYGGVATDAQGRVLRFEEKKAGNEPALINGGVAVVSDKAATAFEAPQRFSWETEWVPKLLESGRALFAFPSNGRFLDIGIPSDYEAAKTFFVKREGRA